MPARFSTGLQIARPGISCLPKPARPGSRNLTMHRYRTHTCGALRLDHAGQEVRLSGWVHRKRDHGNLLFVDLRDQYGLTQCVVDVSSAVFKTLEAVRPESVISVTGKVVPRSAETVNDKLSTG